jgi:phosphinothricin acetyltransferase
LIRAGAPADLPALVAIYNHYVETSHVTFDKAPFTVETRRAWFDRFGAAGRYRLFVAEENGEVVGYAGSQPFHERRAYETSVETAVYARRGATGRGLGRALYEALFEALATEDVHRAYASIALPNPASIALHERFGFHVVGTYREVGRKFGKYWDVRRFERGVA